MTKFAKIVCIGFCFGICNLRSETYNVITVSRSTTATNYNKLTEEEIYLVFAQLARCFTGSDDFLKSIQIPEKAKENLIKFFSENPINPRNPTIIVFNEAFFGQYEPLSKKEVDEIIEIYKKFQFFMPNAYLYVNFLYIDTNDTKYEEQIKISKARMKK